MARRAYLILLAVACCPTPRPLKGDSQMGNDRSDCQASLRALVEGRLGDVTGFAGCRRADVEIVLGTSPPGPDAVGGTLGPHRSYPNGVTVFFAGDTVTAGQILAPRLRQPPRTALGEPEGSAPSRLEPYADQLIWARRGITVHVDRGTGAASWLFFYPPMSVADFLRSPMASAEIRDEPID
jgi:hypothetical protein